MTQDYYKRLGKKEEITPRTADFYVHEFWPNSEMLPPRGVQGLVEWGVKTEAGTMLVAYMWWDMPANQWYIRRATSMNTTRWID